MTLLGLLITTAVVVYFVAWFHIDFPQFAVPLGILLLAAAERWSWIPVYVLSLLVLVVVGVCVGFLLGRDPFPVRARREAER